jgi:hypothetical protein
MKGERDLGAMISFDVRKEKHLLKNLKIDAGIFNGQGITASGDFDNVKDFIGRISLKPKKISKNITLFAGTSLLYGGLENSTKYVYSAVSVAGIKKVVVDSSQSNNGKVSSRKYYGIDAQIKNKIGFTELRGEFITGKQVGTAFSSETPSALLTVIDGYYNRYFNGAYFYLLQNIFSVKHQSLLKYDWYDPNTKIKGAEIGAKGSNFTMADIKYTTIGVGYVYYATPNLKSIVYYSMPTNEKITLQGATTNIADNVFTWLLQFRF